MDHIEECGMAEGPMGMAPPAPEMDKGNPVTVNVSMNASGKEHVADLLDMMKNAGLGDAAPAADAMMSPRMDMERLSGIMSEPADGLDDKAMSLPAPDDIEGSEDESYANEMYDEADLDEGAMSNVHAEIEAADDRAQAVMDIIDKNGPEGKYLYGELEQLAIEAGTTFNNAESEPEDFLGDLLDNMGISAYKDEAATEDMSSEGTYTIKVKGKNMDSQNELARIAQLSGVSAPQEMETEASGDYENEPDEQYSDLSAVIPDGDDLHKQKKSHPAVSGGDNPMAVESIKAALYAALTEKKKPDANGNGIPDYAEDGKGKNDTAKGKKPKKGQVPPQFQKGKKDTKTAEGRGRGKKTKLTAGRGRGK